LLWHWRKKDKQFLNGRTTSQPLSILKDEERFYRELYKSNMNKPNIGEKVSAFLNDLTIPQLSEGLIPSEECSELLDSFQSIKLPGNDGIPVEFY